LLLICLGCHGGLFLRYALRVATNKKRDREIQNRQFS